MKNMRLLIADQWIMRSLALLQVTVLILLSAWVAVRKSPVGVHCPTANVQTIQQVVTHKSCCGFSESKTITRAPQLGDKDFKQCHCAEKKSTERQAEKEAQVTEVQKIVLMDLPTQWMALIAIPIHTAPESSPATLLLTRTCAPLEPPPNFI